MSLTVTYRDLNSPDFFAALDKIDSCTTLPVKAAISFNRIRKVCLAEHQAARELVVKVFNKHAEMETVSENDKIVSRPKRDSKGEIVFKEVDKFNAEFDELLSHSFTVECSPIAAQAFDGVGLTPRMLRAIEPLLEPEETKPCQKLAAVAKPKKK